MADPINILDLDPKSFEVYFREGQRDRTPEQNQFLLEAYRKRQSSLAPFYDAMEATNQAVADEGRRRLNVLPFTVPQGMSFYDALQAGEQEFAAPGFLMGTAESAANVVDMPSATLRGPVSAEARDQAAVELSEYLMAGAAPAVARAAAQGVDPTVVRMAGIGDNGGPPLDRPSSRLESGLYSPSLDAIQRVNQDRGTYEQLRAQILKAGGKEEELRFAGLDDMFDPKEKVTRQELEDILGQRINMVGVEETRATGRIGDQLDPNDYDAMNRAVFDYVQQNLDTEREYFRNEVFPQLASEQLIPLREYITPADTPTLDALTGVSSADLDARRLQMMEREVGRAGYNSIDEYLESFPDAQVEPVGGYLYDSTDEAIEGGLVGDLEEEAIRSLEETAYGMDPAELAEAAGYDRGFEAGDTQYSSYMTPGISEYRERRYYFSDPGEVMSNPAEPRGLPSTHFESDPTKPFLHTRTGFASVAGGTDNAYHVGEIQSDFAQGQRTAYSVAPEETPADRTLIRLGSQMPGSMTATDWKQLQRMPDNENVVPELRGNVLERLSLDPDRPLELEDYQSAVALAHGAKRTMLNKGMEVLFKDQQAKLDQLEELFATTDNFDEAQQRAMMDTLLEQQRRETRDAENFLRDPDSTRYLLTSTYVPEWVEESIAKREWLSDQDIEDLFLEGYRVPAAVEIRQTMAQRGVNPEIYKRIVQQGLESERRTRSPQPFIGSTNRWVDYALKNELVNAAKEGKSFFTVSNPEMVRRMTYGSEEGQGEFYGKIVPQRLKNLVKKLDKNIVVTMDPDEAQAARLQRKPVLGPVRLDADNRSETVLGLTLTPEVRRKILGEEGMGLSSFRDGGLVSLLPTHNP